MSWRSFVVITAVPRPPVIASSRVPRKFVLESIHPTETGSNGRPSTISSESVALASSLVNRLRATTASRGSTLFTLTWKQRATPSGLLISALRASAHRIADNGCGSWPTPMAGTPAQNGNNEAGNTDSSRRTVALAAGATPCTRDYRFANLKSFKERGGMKGEQLNNQVAHLLPDSGQTQNGFHAQTGKLGQLSPEHSRWLMGYGIEWASCAPTATPSCRKLRRK